MRIQNVAGAALYYEGRVPKNMGSDSQSAI
jgi:hypothetical protein